MRDGVDDVVGETVLVRELVSVGGGVKVAEGDVDELEPNDGVPVPVAENEPV